MWWKLINLLMLADWVRHYGTQVIEYMRTTPDQPVVQSLDLAGRIVIKSGGQRVEFSPEGGLAISGRPMRMRGDGTPFPMEQEQLDRWEKKIDEHLAETMAKEMAQTRKFHFIKGKGGSDALFH